MLPDAERSGVREVTLDAPLALKEAERRVRQLPEISESFKRSNAEALEECLTQASEVVRDHARPAGIFLALEARHEDGALCLGRARVRNAALRKHIPPGGRVILYLATTGYTNVAIFEAVQRDYVAYHFQHYLSLQLLYASANMLHAEILRREGTEYVRYSILERAARNWQGGSEHERSDGLHLYWDAKAITELFAEFDPNPLGVKLTEAGGLNPVYSLLGILAEKRQKGTPRQA